MFFSLFPSFNYILSFNLAYIKGPKKKVDGMKEKRRKKTKKGQETSDTSKRSTGYPTNDLTHPLLL
jgi:hypothetical protein